MTRTCLVLLLLGAASAGAAQTAPFLVAADEGTRLRPIARYDGMLWTSSCDLPATPAAPSPDGRAPRLVATAGLPVEAVRTVPRGGVEWRQVEPVVMQLFQQRERQQNVSPVALATVPVSIDSIAANPQSATPQVYYFRASKTIPDSRGDVDLDDDGEVDPKGDLRIDVTGWVRRAGELTSIGTNATLSWEQVDDRPAGTGTRRTELNPIGIVRAADKTVWVMRERAGESTWYTLYDVGATGIRRLVRSESGSC